MKTLTRGKTIKSKAVKTKVPKGCWSYAQIWKYFDHNFIPRFGFSIFFKCLNLLFFISFLIASHPSKLHSISYFFPFIWWKENYLGNMQWRDSCFHYIRRKEKLWKYATMKMIQPFLRSNLQIIKDDDVKTKVPEYGLNQKSCWSYAHICKYFDYNSNSRFFSLFSSIFWIFSSSFLFL